MLDGQRGGRALNRLGHCRAAAKATAAADRRRDSHIDTNGVPQPRPRQCLHCLCLRGREETSAPLAWQPPEQRVQLQQPAAEGADAPPAVNLNGISRQPFLLRSQALACLHLCAGTGRWAHLAFEAHVQQTVGLIQYQHLHCGRDQQGAHRGSRDLGQVGR